MAKKNKANIRLEKIISVTLIVIFIAAFFISLGIFDWQKRKADIAEHKLQEQMDSYKNIITEFNKMPKSEPGISDEDVQVIKDEYSADAGISFSECGLAGYFKKQEWYQGLLDKLAKNSLTAKNISGACLSADKSMFIFIAQSGTYCEGPKMYRYNTINGNLALASVIDKGISCLGSLKTFGKRDGNVIHMVAPGNGECRREEYYDYNFIQNSVELKKSRSLCDGDSNWKVTEY